MKAAKIWSREKAKILIQKKGYGKRKISNIEIQKIYKGSEKLFIFTLDLSSELKRNMLQNTCSRNRSSE